MTKATRLDMIVSVVCTTVSLISLGLLFLYMELLPLLLNLLLAISVFGPLFFVVGWMFRPEDKNIIQTTA